MSTRATRVPWWALLVVAVLQLVYGLATFGRFPPVADGTFYHGFAVRLAAGLGYTFAWPDGAITYAAHYPVGYPALLSVLYRAFGPHAGLAWVLGASLHLGATAALAARSATPRAALFVTVAYGLHPALFFYTPALMTEAVTANLLVLAVACLVDSRSPLRGAMVAGVVFGVATLVRPQSILIPLGLAVFVLFRERRAGWRRAVVLVVLPFVVVLPWTARNCERMKSCALVSVNGGWNLLIGAHTDNGAWQALDTPAACREVWDEAAKDTCFGQQARLDIRHAPAAWLARMPRKAQATFDYFGAAPYTLHESNPVLVDERTKTVLAVAETGWQRVLWLLAAGSFVSRRRHLVSALAMIAGVCALFPHGAALTVIGLGVLSWLTSDRARADSTWRFAGGLVLFVTLVLHATFFGGGRYGLVVVPWVAWLAGSWLGQGRAAVESAGNVHGSSSSAANG